MSKDDKRKIATLWDSKREDNHDHDQEGQAFYAGGSERSGQQILGPSRPHRDDIEDLFSQARQHAIGSGGPESASSSSSHHHHQPDDPSALPTLDIRFWRNGFTVGDGDLREYGTAENRQFMECLKRGETPNELTNIVRNGLVEVKLENHGTEDFKPVKKIKPFSGEGHRLGAPTPETVSEEHQPTTETHEDGESTKQTTQQKSTIDEICTDASQPSTSVQVRLLDNSRLLVRVNLTQTISDIVTYVRTARPQYAGTNFVLATTYPARELCDLQQTIVDANLQNATVLQKIKR